MLETRLDVNYQGPSTGHAAPVFGELKNVSNGQNRVREIPKRHALSEGDSASARKHEGPVIGDAPEDTAVDGNLRSIVLIWKSASMFWHFFTKITAGVSRGLPPGNSVNAKSASMHVGHATVIKRSVLFPAQQ